MSLRVTWIIVALVAVAAIVAGIWYWQRPSNQPTNGENLNQAITAASDVAIEEKVAVPSANALEKAAPTVNPVEKTNPFKSEYANPFE